MMALAMYGETFIWEIIKQRKLMHTYRAITYNCDICETINQIVWLHACSADVPSESISSKIGASFLSVSSLLFHAFVLRFTYRYSTTKLAISFVVRVKVKLLGLQFFSKLTKVSFFTSRTYKYFNVVQDWIYYTFVHLYLLRIKLDTVLQ